MSYIRVIRWDSIVPNFLTPNIERVTKMDVYTIENKYGSLIIDSGHKPTLGLQAFAEYFCSLSGCVFMPNEKRFYIYNRIVIYSSNFLKNA